MKASGEANEVEGKARGGFHQLVCLVLLQSNVALCFHGITCIDAEQDKCALLRPRRENEAPLEEPSSKGTRLREQKSDSLSADFYRLPRDPNKRTAINRIFHSPAAYLGTPALRYGIVRVCKMEGLP